jgi:hypothetical protein
MKDRVFVTPFPAMLVDLRTRITATITVTTTRYKEFDMNLITCLMCVVLRVEHILNICNVPEKKLVFLSINTNSVYLRYIKLK